MDTAIVFTDNTIRVLCGTVQNGQLRVGQAQTLQLPEGALINGLITEEEIVRDALQTIRQKKLIGRKVYLAVDSTEILYKVVQIPNLNPAQTRAAVRREFDNRSDQTEQPIFDYTEMDKKTRILSCTMSQQMLHSYQSVFRAAGIPLDACDMQLNCIIKALHYLPLLKEERLVLSFIENGRMLSCLFAQGQFLYANRVFLHAAPDAKDYHTEIVSSLSSINQFYQSEKGDVSLDKIYINGLKKDILTAIAAETGIHVEPFPNLKDNTFPLGDYFTAAGCLMRTRNDLNFIRAAGIRQKTEKSVRSKRHLWPLLPAALLFVGMGTWGLLQWRTTSLEKEKANCTAAIQAIQADTSYQQAIALETELAGLQKNNTVAAAVRNAVDSYPTLSKSLFTKLAAAAGGTITVNGYSYHAADGLLTLNGQTNNAVEIAAFVQRLRQTDLFTSLSYSGYSKKIDTEQYEFQLSGVLKEGRNHD